MNKKYEYEVWSYSICGCREWFKYGYKTGYAVKVDDDPEYLDVFSSLDEAISNMESNDQLANEIRVMPDDEIIVRETVIHAHPIGDDDYEDLSVLYNCKRTKVSNPERSNCLFFDTFAEAKAQCLSNGETLYLLQTMRRNGCSETIIDSVAALLEEDVEVWYEIMYSKDDEDWGDGTDDLEEAVDRVRRMHAEDFPDAYIAITLDRDGNGNPEQIGEFKQF